ncbi:MAG: glutamine--fructose-6-phosphate transaminase (isomerizing) [Planctomycetes bacterium]|nr:glutamine--fructose-6-phosphate transaminase (isomerizing) [Planctomycetota bacterium]
MCGIFGITAHRDIAPFLVDGLSRLEYRGYDSCGIAVYDGDGLEIRKGAGEVAVVRREEKFDELHGETALGHTRWATHGRVSRVNAHPHPDTYGEIAIVHNGILENHAALRTELERGGHSFVSETDSEVIVHLIESEVRRGVALEAAILATIRRLQGTFGLGVISSKEPGVLYAARKESPLIVGVGDDFHCFASDPLAFSAETHRVIYLEDGELVRVDPESVRIVDVTTGSVIHRTPVELHLQSRDTQHDGFADYMSKEIHENAAVARIALATPIEELDPIVDEILESRLSYLTGIGTSYYVAVMAQYAFNQVAGCFLPALSSDELPYLVSFADGDHIIAISQSGETYDTLKALRQAMRDGARTSAVLNVPTSSMAREVHHAIDQKAGPEICVLSTNSTISQLVILFRVALRLGERNGHLSAAEVQSYQGELERLPDQFDRAWGTSHEALRDLARRHSVIRNWFFLGRSIYHGLALEAALKFKEVTYCHAEGMPAGALKHGTISLIDEAMHSAIFLPSEREEELRTQSLGAVAEINARGGSVVAFQPSGIGDPEGLFYSVVEHPDNGPLTNPLLALMQAQLFAYYTARALGRNVDKPRNLAKSVTVG